MNFSNPILICDESEEFRVLLRDMLTKNGFFHVIEASHEAEILQFMKENSNFLVLIEQKVLTNEIITRLKSQKNFLVFANSADEKTSFLAATLGVSHVISYPFHSRKLIDKINLIL